jgi:LuxR family maltose regulon positive regulatory protein
MTRVKPLPFLVFWDNAGVSRSAAPRIHDWYHRRHLFRRLDRARARPLVWVSAPAGAGKTTLVSTYLAARRVAHHWHRLEAADADVARFLPELEAARRTRGAPLPRPPATAPIDVRAFGRRFFGALLSSAPRPFVLVLDDHQEVGGAPAFDELLRALTESAPPGVTAVVTSRHEPPAILAPAMAAGLCERIAGDELRLTVEEAAGIARKHRGGRRLSREALARLLERAGGWAAGLVLFLETARDDAPGVPGDERVFDFFAGELLARLDGETRRFLLDAALVPEMDETLVARGGAQALARLHRQNLFIERHGAGTFRFHPLFREFLLAEGRRRLAPEALASRRRAAARRLRRAGREADAFELFRAAADWAACEELILESAPALLAAGQRQTLATWIAAVPRARREACPWLCAWEGAATLAVAPPESARLFARAYEGLGARGEREGVALAWAGVVEAIGYEGIDYAPLDGWLARHAELPATLPAPLDLAVAVARFQALALRQPVSPEVDVEAARVLALAGRAPPEERLRAAGALVIHHAYRGSGGDLAAARDLIESTRAGAPNDPLSQLAALGARAIVAQLRGDCAGGLAATRAGLEVSAAAGIHIWDVHLVIARFDAAVIERDVALAAECVDALAQLVPRAGRFGQGSFQFHAGWLALLRGDRLHALRAAELSARTADELGFPFGRAMGRVAMVRVLVELGRAEEAAALLPAMRRLVRASGSALVEMVAHLAEADVAAARGDAPAERRHLVAALGIGRGARIFRMFWQTPESLGRLCARALEEGIEPDYVRELIRCRRVRPQAPPLGVPGWPWPVAVRTLGGLSLEVPGNGDAAGRKLQKVPLRLLAAVVAWGGAAGVDELCDAVWPDAEADAARRALDTTLHRLRSLLGRDDAVVLAAGDVRLDPFTVWTDVGAFGEACTRVEAGAGGAARLLELYRGPFLPGESAAWAISARERLRRRFLAAVGALAEDAERRGRGADVVALLEAALEREELAEPLYRRLIQLHVARGRPSAAREVFERCRRLLAAREGRAPSPDLARDLAG